MAFDQFEGQNVFGWAIDDWDTFNEAIEKQFSGGNSGYLNYLEKFQKDSYKKIELLFESASIPLNLGGQTDKARLIATDKPMGVFDFGLATRGMYKVPEYFSQRLADDYPDKFKEYELEAGIVPPNLIKQVGKEFFYEDSDGRFQCIIQQKGTRAIDLGVVGAKKKYATRNKKVYLTFKRNRGKVRYAEIYSLFYYTSLNTDVQFAIRHIPALMVAEYLESIGIKTRFYMTRFVQLSFNMDIREKDASGNKLPLYDKNPKKKFYGNSLFIQPIIAKDFAEEFDKARAFLISTRNMSSVYDAMAKYSLKKEVMNDSPPTGGNPDWQQDDYFEGLDRYRNKYNLYNKLGFFRSKEVLPEAMLFFHDMVIKWRFASFIGKGMDYFNNVHKNETEFLLDNYVNPFFNWWMRLSANNLKNKVMLINSNELVKDLKNMYNNLELLVDELKFIVNNIPEKDPKYRLDGFKNYILSLGNRLLEPTNEKTDTYGYTIIGDKLNNKGKITFKAYITTITSEISTYAEGEMFMVDKETKERKDELLNNIQEALIQNF